MVCYAVIDTNVLVAALLSNKDDAATVQVIGRMISGEIIPVYSRYILNEYREVLRREKFGFREESIDSLLHFIEAFGLQVEPTPSGVVLPDMKDVPFYEVVLEKKEQGTYLVTGNIKHFPKEPFIVTARQLIDILNK